MKSLFTGLCILLAVSLWQTSAVAQSSIDSPRETLEQVFFSIERLPSAGGQGSIVVYPLDAQTGEPCNSCRQRLRFDQDLQIRISGARSLMTVEQLAAVPQQPVHVVIQGRDLKVIGFAELQLDAAIGGDI